MSDGSRGRRGQTGQAGQAGQSGQPQRFYFDDLADDPAQSAPTEEAEPEPKFAPPPQPAPPERPLVVPVQAPAQPPRSSTARSTRPATPVAPPRTPAAPPAMPTAPPRSPAAPPSASKATPRAARDHDDDDMADTGPIEVIRDPVLGSAAAVQQLHFDDLAPLPLAEPEPEPYAGEAVPAGSDEEPVRSALAVVAARRPRPVGAVLAVLVVLALIGVIAAVSGRGHGNNRKDTASLGTSHHTSATTGNPTPSTEPTATASAATSAPGPKPHRTPATQVLTPTNIPLTVLNNTIQHGLAKSAAQLFSGRGWQIDNVGNYTGQIPLTTVYYSPGSAAQHKAAETLAAEFPGVTQVQPRFANLPGTGLTVVLAPDWHL